MFIITNGCKAILILGAVVGGAITDDDDLLSEISIWQIKISGFNLKFQLFFFNKVCILI